MTKITLELIENSIQRTNPLKDRELDLKGNKISLIENLGTTLDQFDALDFTDNEIHRFDGFPHLKRLKSINFTNNKIVRIAKDLSQFIGNVSSLILINNNIQEMREIDNLACFKHLDFLALLKNPIAAQQHYRLQVIHKLPQLRILDFSRVKDSERRQASALFASKGSMEAVGVGGAAVRHRVGAMPITNGGGDMPPNGIAVNEVVAMDMGDTNVATTTAVGGGASAPIRRPTIADMQALRAAIQNASSNDEVDRLNYLCSSGKFAGFADVGQRMFRG